MSAPLIASATPATFNPACLALSQEAPPFLRPTVTLTPDSLRLSECAWPCEP